MKFLITYIVRQADGTLDHVRHDPYPAEFTDAAGMSSQVEMEVLQRSNELLVEGKGRTLVGLMVLPPYETPPPVEAS